MVWLLLYDVVDDYVARRAPFRSEHLALVQRAHQSGDLVMAGALAEPVDGAVLVFRSREAAESFVQTDPYVRNGLIPSWRLRQWNVVVGDSQA